MVFDKQATLFSAGIDCITLFRRSFTNLCLILMSLLLPKLRLEGDEKQKIVNGLKIKWAVVNAEYLKLPFIADTDAQKIRKNRFFFFFFAPSPDHISNCLVNITHSMNPLSGMLDTFHERYFDSEERKELQIT